MTSFYLFIFITLLTSPITNGAIKNENCEKSGVAKNFQELARKFEHLSLQQKRKIKEWSSEKTLEENLAAFNVTDLVKDMHLQQCVIVEIGEGFCSLFVETRNETGYSCNGTTSNIQELFIGMCECSKIHTWRFCGPQLFSEHQNECTFKEATSKQDNSARVHRRLCDITEMIKWNTCNCSHSINDQILLQTEGFPSCYRAPISQSVCYPRSVCGRSKCTPVVLASNVRSMVCDPECPGGRPFCEDDSYPSSIASEVTSEWSNWDEPECNATSGEGFLISRATCLDKISGNCARDCFGPWKSCCPPSISPCVCDVSILNDSLIATRTLGPCTTLSDDDEPETQSTASFETLDTCEGTTPRNDSSPPSKPSDEYKHLGPELMRKMVESLTKSVNLIPGVSRNSRRKEENRAKLQRSNKDECGTRRLWKIHKAKQRGSERRRRKRVVSDGRRQQRRLLQWEKRDGEYIKSSEICKRDSLSAPTKPETWEDDEDAELEIPEYEVENQTKTSPGMSQTCREKRLNATKAEMEDINEEEEEEDEVQEEQVSEGSCAESHGVQDESDSDFRAISEEPASSDKNHRQKPAKAKEKILSMKEMMNEKHKTEIKETEYFEDEEEGDEDEGEVGEGEKKILARVTLKGVTEEMSPEEQQMDGFGPDYYEPGKAVEKNQPNAKSKAKARQTKSSSKNHLARQSKSLRKKVVSERNNHLRRLLWWRKHDGKYDYINETPLQGGTEILCKRDCRPPPTKPETWDDNDETDLEILEDGADTESSVQAVSETEGIPVTDSPHASSAKKVTLPHAEINDIDEEEAEEDAGQEDQSSQGSDHESQEIPGANDFDLDAISEKGASESNDTNNEINATEKSTTTPKVLLEKKKSGKGIGRHKTRLKPIEVPEEEEEEIDEDPTENTRTREEAIPRGEFEETLDELDDDFGSPDEATKEPKKASTDTESEAKSKAIWLPNNILLAASSVLLLLV